MYQKSVRIGKYGPVFKNRSVLDNTDQFLEKIFDVNLDQY